MGNPHVLAVPSPGQDHVIPLMEIAVRLAKHGIKITFAVAEFIQRRVKSSMFKMEGAREFIQLVAIPDALELFEDRNDFGKVMKSMAEVVPEELEALIQRINSSEGDRLTCVLADASMGWAVSLAKKLGVKSVAFWPAPTAILDLLDSIPSLVTDGIIDSNGKLMKDEMITLLPNLPPLRAKELFWYGDGDASTEKLIFDSMVKMKDSLKLADMAICNSSHDLEFEALSSHPNIKPIGPLLASNQLRKVGNSWSEALSCQDWLDHQTKNSVIHVAFRSLSMFDRAQFQELALGLELANMPFLWVVRQDITLDIDKAYPEGFLERVGDRGLIVNWVPQEKVLSHPSVACFISHCGWNSTTESIGNGVPSLCWPHFSDQFYNQSYICDHWKVGLKLERDQNGMVSQNEIKTKVEQLLEDPMFKARALDLQEKLISGACEGGSSYENFKDLVEWIQG